MNTEQTRQLGIEFERRIQTMLPQKEFFDKMDTETIYSFLNQYQDKYIHEIFNSLNKISEDESLSIRINTVLKELIRTEDLTFYSTDGLMDIYSLPVKFSMYIKSVSKVNKFYRFKNEDQLNGEK